MTKDLSSFYLSHDSVI